MHEKFFRYLKEKTIVFYHRMSARNHYRGYEPQNITKPIHNILLSSEEKCVGNTYQNVIMSS
jgi:hypothetical protein